jgi:hypothetical protein
MGQVILLQGGIGDFLQCLPFIDANKDLIDSLTSL